MTESLRDRTRNAERRGTSKGAERRRARNAERRGTPKGAERRRAWPKSAERRRATKGEGRRKGEGRGRAKGDETRLGRLPHSLILAFSAMLIGQATPVASL